MKYKCLSIAGFDGSGGAGIQADLKTFSAFGCYGMTILTALPVQNTSGVMNCYPIPLSAIEEQLHCLFEDITPTSIKIGMLFSVEVIELVAHFLEKNAVNIPIVLDPVMVAKSGDRLLQTDAILALKTQVIPMANIITPNLPEAYTLVGSQDNANILAKKLLALPAKAVLLKGGHDNHSLYSNDLYLDTCGQEAWLRSERIQSKNTHGTGCTLSAAICSGLALGFSTMDACQYAKQYISAAIKHAQHHSVGQGHGPVHHFYHLWPAINKIIGD